MIADVEKIGKKILGTGSKVTVTPDSVQWNKRGDYADAAFSSVRDKLAKNGFTRVDTTPSNSQFEVFGNAETWRREDGITATLRSWYGLISDDNHFVITIKGG